MGVVSLGWGMLPELKKMGKSLGLCKGVMPGCQHQLSPKERREWLVVQGRLAVVVAEPGRVTSSEQKGAGRAEQAQQLERECNAQQKVQRKEGLAKSPEKGTTRQPSEVEEKGRERDVGRAAMGRPGLYSAHSTQHRRRPRSDPRRPTETHEGRGLGRATPGPLLKPCYLSAHSHGTAPFASFGGGGLGRHKAVSGCFGPH